MTNSNQNPPTDTLHHIGGVLDLLERELDEVYAGLDDAKDEIIARNAVFLKPKAGAVA